MFAKLTDWLTFSGTLSPLLIPDFRRLMLGNALWWHALYMEMIVMGWLVQDLTGSAWSVALIGFFRSLPFLITGIFGGLLTDRFGRRAVIISAQSAALMAYVLIALLIWSNLLALWHLGACSFILGLAWSLDFPARRALMPDIVGKEKTLDALLVDSFGQGIMRISGPLLAGWLIVTVGAAGCFAVAALMSLIALVALWQLSQQPIPRTNREAKAPPWTLIGQGLGYVRHNQPILAVVLITVVMNLLIFPYMSLLPTFAADVLKSDALGLGMLGTGTGAGAFLGLYVISRLRRLHSGGLIFAVGTICQCTGLAVFALSTYYPLSWVMLFLAGMGQSCFALMQSSIVLLAASDEMRSRAMGSVVLAIGTDPLGKLQTGALAERYGAPATLAGQASLAATLIILIAVALPGLRRMPIETAAEVR